MSDYPLEPQIESLFVGIEATKESFRNIQEVYNPTLAFKFNSFNFFSPGENKVSQILSFFLNPNQTHGQGKVFLDLFLSELCNKEINYSSARVYIEYLLPNSRRMDILILFNENEFAIGIENKIWARDQENQLLDYNNFLSESYGDNYMLFYLNPYKQSPSSASIDPQTFQTLNNKKLFVIDYSTEVISLIRKWTIHCRAERVRSFLIDFEQYLQQEINGETFMNEHEMIVDFVTKNNDRIKTAFLVEGAANKIREALVDEFVKQLKNLATDLNLRLDLGNNPFYKEGSGFTFSNDLLDRLHLTIGFEFEEKWYRELAFGVIKKGALHEELIIELRKCLDREFNLTGKSTELWPWYTYFTENRNWNNQTYISIHNQLLINDVKEKVQSILNAVATIQRND